MVGAWPDARNRQPNTASLHPAALVEAEGGHQTPPMKLNEERELKQSLVGFPLLKHFSHKTSFSPSLIMGAWNFSLSNRLILVRLNLVP
jgi:hypothetical protein